MTAIADLIRLIGSGALLRRSAFEELDVEAALESRDNPEFERNWLTLFRRLESVPVAQEHKDKTDILREIAFRTVYAYSNDPELAGEVSDDFEVIAKSALAVPENEFAGSLLETYASGRIPGGGSLQVGRPVRQVIAELASHV